MTAAASRSKPVAKGRATPKTGDEGVDDALGECSHRGRKVAHGCPMCFVDSCRDAQLGEPLAVAASQRAPRWLTYSWTPWRLGRCRRSNRRLLRPIRRRSVSRTWTVEFAIAHSARSFTFGYYRCTARSSVTPPWPPPFSTEASASYHRRPATTNSESRSQVSTFTNPLRTLAEPCQEPSASTRFIGLASPGVRHDRVQRSAKL